MLIDRAIDSTLANRTSIVIAHRLSTIKRAGHILVMEQGRIVEEGSHDSLMAKGGIYRRLQDLQIIGQAGNGVRNNYQAKPPAMLGRITKAML
jgi:ATP-binding cassette subfamily B protein